MHPVESSPQGPEANAERSPPTTLLVLDDSAEDREVFRRLLSSDGRQDYIIHEFTAIEDAFVSARDARDGWVAQRGNRPKKREQIHP